MKRSPRLVAGFGMALCLLTGTATAMPPVMDRVPTGAAIVIGAPSIENLEKNIKSVAALVGAPLPGGVEDLLGQLGIKEGFNKAGSLVLVLMEAPKEDDQNPPKMIVLVPTNDYAGLLKGLGATATAGVDEVNMPTGGEPGYFKKIEGGYAALSPQKDLLEKYTGQPGKNAEHSKFVGSIGDRLADTGDVFIILNIDSMRDLIKKGADEAFKEAADNMAMVGGAEGNMDGAKFMTTMLIDQTQSIVASMKVDGLGISADLGFNFKAGSSLAKTASRAGTASNLLGKLPNQPYLLALALDLTSPELKQAIADMPKPKDQPGFAGMDLQSTIKNTDGASFLMGVSPGGVMGGLLTASVSYTATKDYAAAVGDFKKSLAAMETSKFATGKYTEGGADVNGAKVDTFDIKISGDADNPQMAQGMMMMFGPGGGPSGYVAKTEGGFYTTYSKSNDLLTSSLKAGKGENSLSKDQLIEQVSKKLPAGSAAIAFIGSKGILDTVQPLVGMFMGGKVKFDMPAQVPPIAAALAPSEGQVQATVFLPSDTLKTFAGYAKALQASQNGGDGEPEAKNDEKPNRKPGF